MRIHAETHPPTNQGHWRVVNLDTGEEIPNILWADDQTGEYERFLRNADGNFYVDDATEDAAREVGKARIYLVAPGEGLPDEPLLLPARE